MVEEDRMAFGRNRGGQDMQQETFHEDEDEDEDEDVDGGGDPTVAFEALRETIEDLAADLSREMTTIRKGVESAFDQFERQGVTVDYSADLGRITQQLASVVERLQAVEKSPILRQGAEHYAHVFERSGKSLVHAAAQQFQNESRDFQRVARELAGQMSSARERQRQNRWLVGIGGAGIVLGVLLTLFVPRMFPKTAAPLVASTVMGDTIWNAGMSLLSYASPAVVQRVAVADNLIEANKDAVAVCRTAAAKAGKEQKCTIIVPTPQK